MWLLNRMYLKCKSNSTLGNYWCVLHWEIKEKPHNHFCNWKTIKFDAWYYLKFQQVKCRRKCLYYEEYLLEAYSKPSLSNFGTRYPFSQLEFQHCIGNPR